MPLRQFIENDAAFQPHELAVMTAAFEEALGKLGLNDRKDQVTELVARKIIELAKRGERDPVKLCADVLKAFKDGSAAAPSESTAAGYHRYIQYLLEEPYRCLVMAAAAPSEHIRASLLNVARLSEREVTLIGGALRCIANSRELIVKCDALLQDRSSPRRYISAPPAEPTPQATEQAFR